MSNLHSHPTYKNLNEEGLQKMDTLLLHTNHPRELSDTIVRGVFAWIRSDEPMTQNDVFTLQRLYEFAECLY